MTLHAYGQIDMAVVKSWMVYIWLYNGKAAASVDTAACMLPSLRCYDRALTQLDRGPSDTCP